MRKTSLSSLCSSVEKTPRSSQAPTHIHVIRSFAPCSRETSRGHCRPSWVHASALPRNHRSKPSQVANMRHAVTASARICIACVNPNQSRLEPVPNRLMRHACTSQVNTAAATAGSSRMRSSACAALSCGNTTTPNAPSSEGPAITTWPADTNPCRKAKCCPRAPSSSSVGSRWKLGRTGRRNAIAAMHARYGELRAPPSSGAGTATAYQARPLGL